MTNFKKPEIQIIHMNKKGFFKLPFGIGKKKETEENKEDSDQSDLKIKKEAEKQETEETSKEIIKDYKAKLGVTPTKKILAEEMKMAKKIAKEYIKHGFPEEDKKQNIPNGGEAYKTGIVGFDALLKGRGIPGSSSVLVEGGPGSGKTIFCLHVAKSFCEQGKKVLYMSFEEPEDRLKNHMEAFGMDVKKYVKNGTLVIKRFNALDIARSVEALLSEAKKELLIEVQPILIPQDIDPDLVLVDSLTSIASAFSGEENRFRIYMEQLFRYLEEHKMSSLLIREVANPGHIGEGHSASDEATSFLSDGIIVFYNVVFNTGKRSRAVEILKLRGQPFTRSIVEAEIIDKKGLEIYPHKPLKGSYKLT
jgi:KaiC/GvpD/RAD55 family RecA-like ATPase